MSSAAVDAFSGGIGSLIALVSTYPLKTIYTLQAIEAKQKGHCQHAALLRIAATEPSLLLHHVLSGIKSRDIKGLYTGLKPSAVETVASSAVYFYFYSLLRQAVVTHIASRQSASGQAPGTSVSTRAQDIGVVASMAVAALAGAGNMIITTPAAVVTTQMQAIHKQRQDQAAAGLPMDAPASIWRVGHQIWAEGGLASFWKGLLPSLILVVNPAIQYMLFESLMARALRLRNNQQQRAGQRLSSKLGSGDVFLLGALAKIGATVVTYPMIVIKARLQAINGATHADMQYRGTWDAITTIERSEGVPGFFKGMNAKLLQTALNAALTLVIRERIYDLTKRALASPVRMQQVKVQIVK